MFIFSKSFLTSKTMWGIIIALSGGVLSRYGFHVTAADAGTLADLSTQAMELGGAVLAAYGRMKAIQPLHAVVPTAIKVELAAPAAPTPASALAPDLTTRAKTVVVMGHPWIKG